MSQIAIVTLDSLLHFWAKHPNGEYWELGLLLIITLVTHGDMEGVYLYCRPPRLRREGKSGLSSRASSVHFSFPTELFLSGMRTVADNFASSHLSRVVFLGAVGSFSSLLRVPSVSNPSAFTDSLNYMELLCFPKHQSCFLALDKSTRGFAVNGLPFCCGSSALPSPSPGQPGGMTPPWGESVLWLSPRNAMC